MVQPESRGRRIRELIPRVRELVARTKDSAHEGATYASDASFDQDLLRWREFLSTRRADESMVQGAQPPENNDEALYTAPLGLQSPRAWPWRWW